MLKIQRIYMKINEIFMEIVSGYRKGKENSIAT